MAVSGLPEPCQTHARCIARLALDMMDLGREVQVDGEPVVSGRPKSIHSLVTLSLHSIHRANELRQT
jgi:hypothetical protein